MSMIAALTRSIGLVRATDADADVEEGADADAGGMVVVEVADAVLDVDDEEVHALSPSSSIIDLESTNTDGINCPAEALEAGIAAIENGCTTRADEDDDEDDDDDDARE